MYKAINDLNRKKSRSSISVKDENGKRISDPELVRNRWKEYTEKLYNAEGKPHSLNVDSATDMDDIGPCILEEVATAIKELKNNKCVSRTDTNPPFAFQIAFFGQGFTGFLQGVQGRLKRYVCCLHGYF